MKRLKNGDRTSWEMIGSAPEVQVEVEDVNCGVVQAKL